MNGIPEELSKELDEWMEREEKRIDELNKEHANGEVVQGFLRGEHEGTCPKCGGQAEAVDSDEGPTGNHWMQRYWSCECGAYFTEQYRCVPDAIWLTEV